MPPFPSHKAGQPWCMWTANLEQERWVGCNEEGFSREVGNQAYTESRGRSRSEFGHTQLKPVQKWSLSHTCPCEGCWGLSSRSAHLAEQSFQKPVRRKGREGTEVTMLSTPQCQLNSGVDAPGPLVAAHRELVEHCYAGASSGSGEKAHVEACGLASLAFCYCPDPQYGGEKASWGIRSTGTSLGRPSAEDSAGWQTEAVTVGMCP